jgi:SAM-dependent methyltransferase
LRGSFERRRGGAAYDDPVQDLKTRVAGYWDARPCGEGLVPAPRGSDSYFRDIEQAKDRLEPYVHEFAEFSRWQDRDVLEVGCGVGTDSARFARHGARITALDLSATSVALAQERLDREGLDGAVLRADAEALPFPDSSFDLVYSWGVLHHTPNTEQAIREVKRVLRPGGEARIMLYNLRSLFALGVWLRCGPLACRLASVRTTLADGLESPGTKAYTSAEVRRLFKPFAAVELRTIATPYDRRVVGPLAELLPGLGWNHLIRARAT